ncbi:MAG: DUF447 family protein [Planctomycetaceae bacterium]|nr:DUF447 family protein [Planctomycetaceae bacterium]
MILEGIVTTRNGDGGTNVAPMGPLVDDALRTLVLRPYRTSTTYQNLKQSGCGVFHVTDDVLMLARAAIGRLDPQPEMFPAKRVTGSVLRSACRWYEFEVVSLDDQQERTRIEARVVHAEWLRDFFGFNRAKHAVLEAAILATRVHLLSREEILAEFARLSSPVEKTCGPHEEQAFQLLWDYVAAFPYASLAPTAPSPSLPSLPRPTPRPAMRRIDG